jgi:hypothetical protein
MSEVSFKQHFQVSLKLVLYTHTLHVQNYLQRALSTSPMIKKLAAETQAPLSHYVSLLPSALILFAFNKITAK